MTCWTVPVEEGGDRLDRLVGRRLGSRRQARREIAAGRVRVDGAIVRIASRPVPEGTEIVVVESAEDPAREPDGEAASPEEPALQVVYRDADLLAVDKPSGLPVQGTRRAGEDHLLAVVERSLRREGMSAGPYLHHRLDRGTSGLVVLALARRANRGLTRAFREGEVEKLYLARVLAGPGAPATDEWSVEDRLLKETRRGVTVVRQDPGGRTARTAFRWIGPPEPDGARWVEARPATGRTHQVRVHLASSGCPILGDVKYGGRRVAAERLMLHARRLGLPHPVHGSPLRLEAPLPEGWNVPGEEDRSGESPESRPRPTPG